MNQKLNLLIHPLINMNKIWMAQFLLNFQTILNVEKYMQATKMK